MVHRVQVGGGIATIGGICHPASARFHPGAPVQCARACKGASEWRRICFSSQSTKSMKMCTLEMSLMHFVLHRVQVGTGYYFTWKVKKGIRYGTKVGAIIINCKRADTTEEGDIGRRFRGMQPRNFMDIYLPPDDEEERDGRAAPVVVFVTGELTRCHWIAQSARASSESGSQSGWQVRNRRSHTFSPCATFDPQWSYEHSGGEGRVQLLTDVGGCCEQAVPGSSGTGLGAPYWRAASVSRAQSCAVWTIATTRRCIHGVQLLVYAGMEGITTSAA